MNVKHHLALTFTFVSQAGEPRPFVTKASARILDTLLRQFANLGCSHGCKGLGHHFCDGFGLQIVTLQQVILGTIVRGEYIWDA